MAESIKDSLPLPKKIVESLDKEVRNQLELASAISHPGESGRARENVIAAFLRKLVPKSFGIDTGFVIDSQGQVSRQVDIVIYRTDYHPVLEIGGVKHFLVESVIVVIENKAQITSKSQLDDALDTIASVKRLDRTNKRQNIIVRGATMGPLISPDKFEHQIFGAIVTQKSIAEASLVVNLQEFFKVRNRREWFNLYVDISSFTVCYQRQRGQSDIGSSHLPTVVMVIPYEAEELFVGDPNAVGRQPPLSHLAQELVNFLRVAPLVDFLPTSYSWA